MFLVPILHFNIAALFIFAIIIFYVIYRKLYKSHSSSIFLIINILYFIICVVDLFVSSERLNLTMNKILMFVYYLLKYQVSIVYLLYLFVITHSEDIIRKKKISILFSIPFIITVGFLVSNIFTGYIYTYESGVYDRGPYILVFYGLTFVYVAIGLLWLIYTRKMFDFSDLFALFSVYVLSIGALLIQLFYPNVLIEMLSTSLAMLLLSSTVERSQFIVDQKTGLKNKVNFDRIAYCAFRRKRVEGIVLFHIKNYAIIYEKYRYDEALRNSKILSSNLCKEFIDQYKYDCYYLDGGIYAFVMKASDVKGFAKKLSEFIQKTYDKKVDFNIDYSICSAVIPSDFISFDEFNHFIYTYTDSINSSSRLIDISEIKDSFKNHRIMNLDEILDRVIEEKSIMVEFQPVYELSEKKYTIIEALARINDPDYGVINAENFITYAEKRDKIYDIDMQIIDKVYAFYSGVNFDDLELKCVSINISAQTLCNKNFIEDLKMLELKYGVKKRKIYFEVKERERVSFKQYAFDTIRAMMEEGYLFSLDNYGIGCMPVENLAKVPFVGVKFDNTFAKSCKNKETCVVIDNTIKLFRNLNKVSMCAGVEDEISAKILEELQPDFIQGYYYSKPLPLDSLVAFLIEHNK